MIRIRDGVPLPTAGKSSPTPIFFSSVVVVVIANFGFEFRFDCILSTHKSNASFTLEEDKREEILKKIIINDWLKSLMHFILTNFSSSYM